MYIHTSGANTRYLWRKARLSLKALHIKKGAYTCIKNALERTKTAAKLFKKGTPGFQGHHSAPLVVSGCAPEGICFILKPEPR